MILFHYRFLEFKIFFWATSQTKRTNRCLSRPQFIDLWSFSGSAKAYLTYIAYLVMRIDSHLSELNRNCHLRAHPIRLERSICKSWGSLIGSTTYDRSLYRQLKASQLTGTIGYIVYLDKKQ